MPSNSTHYAGEAIDIGPVIVTRRGSNFIVEARGYKPVTFSFPPGRVSVDTGPDGARPYLDHRGGKIYAVAAGNSEKLDTDLPKRLN